MTDTTFTTHEEVIEYIWSIDKTMQNHIFYIDSTLHRQYSRYSKKSKPEFVKFCTEYNLSLGYVLHENKHPVIMNYYDANSDIESDECCEGDEGGDTNIGDNVPLLSNYN